MPQILLRLQIRNINELLRFYIIANVKISDEIMWETRPFNKEELWNEDGSQPFVYAMGDA